jgi:hypothetical protein
MLRMRRLLLLVLAFAFVLSSTQLIAQCGVERWSVKTGTDADVGKVNLNSSTNTTITSMRAFTAPNPIPANNRITGPETTVWVINATLTLFKLESDSDYHMVLQDASGNTMVTEIPSPSCVASTSPFLPSIQNARSKFDAKFTATTSFQTANIPVQIVGVGMFDFLHGQTGVAPNGIELHPVLDIIFNPGTPTPDFTLSASPSSLSVTQGGTGSTTISTTVSGGFNSAVALSASGLPAGVTASFSPASASAPGSSNLTFTASGAATTGTFNVTVTGTGGGVTHTSTVTLTVNSAATPGFTLSASPSSLSIAQGGVANTTISTAATGGFNSAITLSASGLPAGITASFSAGTIAAPGSGSSTLNLSASSTATTGTFNVTVSATGGGITHTATVVLSVTATQAPDFLLSASPTSLSVAQGSSRATTISSAALGGFNAAVALSTGALPTGVTASFSPGSIAAPGNGSSTLTFSASSTAPTGTFNVTVNGSGGGITHSATVSVTVTAAGGGGTTTQVLGNPGFENGSTNPAPWTATSGVISNSTSEPSHSGTWKAWLDGYGTTHTDTLTQQVAIASNATAATLTFWLHIDTAETTTTTAFDTLALQVRNSSGTVLSTLKTYSNLNKNTGYAQQSFDLTSFKGQTIQINFVGTEDSSLQTSFVVDDFALNVTTPGSTDTTPPTTSVTAPANGASVSGTVSVTATASDNVGVASMQILIDGNIVASNTNATSLTFSFATVNVANGSHTIVSKATDAAGNVGTSATVTVTVSNGGGGTPTERMVNGGFENGSTNPAPWTLTSSTSPVNIINNTASEPAHTGTWDAWLDGFGANHTDTIMQQVAIPSTATTATLTFWLHIDTAETSTTTAFDTLTVQVRDSAGNVLQTLATFSNLNHATGYQQHTFDLSAYIGKTIQIFMNGTEDFELQTSFVVDDVSLQTQ